MTTGGNNSDVIFLLGAGASVEAGVRTSNEITDILINYGSYCPSENSIEIENLLRYIQVRIADYLRVRASEVNFEYILGTLLELSRREEYSIVPFFGDGDILIKKLEKVVSIQDVINKLYALLRELFLVTKSVKYLDPLKAFMSISKPLDIFTLNYDISIETDFDNNRVLYTAGYVSRSGKLPIWDPTELTKISYDARIFKLHGSINWGQHFLYPPPPTISEPTADVCSAAETYLANYPECVEINPFPIGPVEPPGGKRGMVGIMNFGTRKELLYAESIFTTLFNHFLIALSKARICVICGYSFRDQRINKFLEEAVAGKEGNLRLVVVNPDVFPIENKVSVLRKFMELEWSIPIDKELAKALDDGSLVKTVENILKANARPRRIEYACSNSQAEEEKPSIDEILNQWKILGNSFDITYFWMHSILPQLEEYEECSDASRVVEVGPLLMPLVRKVRDLCFHADSLYKAMGFGAFYGDKYLENIKDNPKLIKEFSHMGLIHKWLPKLGSAVHAAYYGFNNIAVEFRRAITDPNYMKDLEPPGKFSAAELIIRHDISRTSELVCILNDIFKGAGYEEPFRMINERCS